MSVRRPLPLVFQCMRDMHVRMLTTTGPRADPYTYIARPFTREASFRLPVQYQRRLSKILSSFRKSYYSFVIREPVPELDRFEMNRTKLMYRHNIDRLRELIHVVSCQFYSVTYYFCIATPSIYIIASYSKSKYR